MIFMNSRGSMERGLWIELVPRKIFCLTLASSAPLVMPRSLLTKDIVVSRTPPSHCSLSRTYLILSGLKIASVTEVENCPMTVPSAGAEMYTQFSPTMPPPPAMFLMMVVGFPGICFPMNGSIWRAMMSAAPPTE